MTATSNTPTSSTRPAKEKRQLALAEKVAKLSATKRQILCHLVYAGTATGFQVGGYVDPIVYAHTVLNPAEQPYLASLEAGSLDDPDELGDDLAIAAVLKAEDGQAVLELHDGRVVVLPNHLEVWQFEEARLAHLVSPAELRTYVLTQVRSSKIEKLAAELDLDERQLAGMELLALRYRRAKQGRVQEALTELADDGFVKRLVLKRERDVARLRALSDPEVRGHTTSAGRRGRPIAAFQLTALGLDVACDLLGLEPERRPSIKKQSKSLARADHALAAATLYGYLNAMQWAGQLELVRFEREYQWPSHGGKSTTPRTDIVVEVAPVGCRRRLTYELCVEIDMATTRKRMPRPGDDQSLVLYYDWRSYNDLARSLKRQLRFVQMVPSFAYTAPATQAKHHATFDAEFKAEVGDKAAAKFVFMEEPTIRNVALRLYRNVEILGRDLRAASPSKAAA